MHLSHGSDSEEFVEEGIIEYTDLEKEQRCGGFGGGMMSD